MYILQNYIHLLMDFYFKIFGSFFVVVVVVVYFFLLLFSQVMLEPLCAWIINFLKDASLFATAVPSGGAGRTSAPSVGIAEHSIVLDKVLGLVRVGMKVISGRFAVVAYFLPIRIASGEFSNVATAQFFRAVEVGVGIVTQVDVDIEKVKCLQTPMVRLLLLLLLFRLRRKKGNDR